MPCGCSCEMGPDGLFRKKSKKKVDSEDISDEQMPAT